MWQGFVEVQVPPAVQATQAPAEQTRFVPQLVPLGRAVVVAVHAGPVLQVWLPTWHGSVGGVQSAPTVQEAQVPAEQTRLVPQLVPSVTFPVSVQTGAPVAQEMAAMWHGFVEVQARPAVQVHTPAVQVSPTPQLVPLVRFPVSVQTDVPVLQEVMPV